jgi:ribosomal protein S18 acetylase RimI-like enzyme
VFRPINEDDLDLVTLCDRNDPVSVIDAVRFRALVGFAIPSRSAYHPSVSYLGVLPRFRGRGFVDDLLAEITHIHAEAGAERITGTTDTTNAPMAAAFGRAGYRNTACRIVLSAPSN